MSDCTHEGGRTKCAENPGTMVCRDGNYQCEYYKTAYTNDEHLIVLDRATTDGLIKFIFENRSTFEFKKLLTAMISNNKDGLPF